MTDRVNVTQDAVYSAVTARLRSALNLVEAQCYEVAEKELAPTLPTGGDYILTVAPGDGTFNEDEQVVGQCIEDTDVTVSIYTRLRKDRTNADKFLLLDERAGLLKIKQLVLKALVGQDLQTTDGDNFLRHLLHARRADRPGIVQKQGEGTCYGCLRITFAVAFDWDLT